MVWSSSLRAYASYGGIRVTLEARLASARIPLQVDIGYGDAVTPEPAEVEFPALLDFPAPHLRAYSYYTVVAEKLEAAVLFGAANTRLKDFFDLWYLSRRFTFEGSLLIEATRQTFARRETAVPADIPTALTDLFAVQKSAQWTAFLRRNSLAPVEFLSALAALGDFLLPVLQTILAKAFFHRTWEPGQGWRSRAVQWLVNIVSSTRALIEQRLVPAACLAAAPK